MEQTQATFRNNSERGRFELEKEGHTAFIAYRREGNILTLTHTEVPEALEGHGVASELASLAFTDIEGRGEKIVPQCAFIKVYLQRHPEWQRLVA